MRKRELTVEVWLRAMQKQREYGKMIGAEAFANQHAMRMTQRMLDNKAIAYSMVDVLYEMQISNDWDNTGRQVYDFDQDFAKSIVNEKWLDLLPDCIERRPHDCFYMKLPSSPLNEGVVVSVVPTENILGFNPDFFPGMNDGKGVYIGGDPDSVDGPKGRTVINTGERTLVLCSFAISKTFELMMDDTPIERYPTELVANGVAYICSKNADIVPSYVPVPNLKRNNAKRRSQATWYDVGYRVGSELRAYNRSAKNGIHHGGTVRPHMRRAHWHHFWTGPRDGERELILKWVKPTMVGANIDSATLHRVG